ncbi:hypothetical protein MMC24_001414 [Lignoscripta atroalba]|nr:hypothetical protein [Lignoscripta atroalba]
MVVIAPDHRDGSAPMSVINGYHGSKGKVVEYNSISHAPSREVEDARDEQLRIRLWELGLVYEALLKIDDGGRLSNIAVNDAPPTNNASIDELSWFASSLDVHTPGAISWSGHSFGGATIVQFVKSVYYRPSKSTPTYRPLYAPSDTSRIVQQITPHSPISLLDLWTLPLRSGSMQWLWNKPLPSYTNGGPGGSNIIAILSEAFFKWRGNLVQTKRAISEDPSMEHPSVSKGRTSPYIFYPISSAHLSQSDFGVLFPYLTKKAFKAEEPERTLRLNVRALLEVLRLNGVQVADTSDIDMENAHQHPVTITMNGHSKDESSHVGKDQSILSQDHKILATDGSVRGWVALSISEESRNGEATNVKTQLRADPSEAVMDGEVLTAGGQDQKLRQI